MSGPATPASPAVASPLCGLLAVAAAALLPLVFSPQAFHLSWAPKAAVGLVVVGPGLVALARLVAARSRPAMLAALFLVWAGLCTLASESVPLAVLGGINHGTGLVFIALLVGCWALGRQLGELRRRQLALILVLVATANALMAWLQAHDLVPPALESPGRSSGFMGNPVHLGALCAGALWLLARRVGREEGQWAWLAAVAAVAGGAQLSGGRTAAVLCAVAVLGGLWRASFRRAAAVLAAACLGFAVFPLGAQGASQVSTRSVGPEAGTQVALRWDLWRMGLEASAERPVWGWGPGRFETATSPRLTAPLVRDGRWRDAHNVVVEYAVTTGPLGLALFGWWLAAAARRSRGPLAGFALAAGLYLLVQPQSVAVTPLILLALGASGPRPADPARAWGGWTAAAAAGSALGLVGAGLLLVGEASLERGFTDSSLPDYRRAHRVLPPWPEVSVLGSRIEAYHALSSRREEHRTGSLALAREATRRDPSDATSWAYVANLELAWGSDARAATAVERALSRNPWQGMALGARAELARRRSDHTARADACRRLSQLGPVPRLCGGADDRPPEGPGLLPSGSRP